MKPIICALFVLVFTVGTASAASWDSIGHAWQHFLQDPTTENAASLYNALPADTGELSLDADTSDILDSIYDSLGVLGYQLETGDSNAVRAAFRLYTIAAGDFGESVDIILGELIRMNPRMFLQELKNHRGIVPSIASLTTTLGPDFIDSQQAGLHEIRLRIMALESVEDNYLADVRDECIAALREAEGLEEAPGDQ